MCEIKAHDYLCCFVRMGLTSATFSLVRRGVSIRYPWALSLLQALTAVCLRRGPLSRFMSVTHLHARMKACHHAPCELSCSPSFAACIQKQHTYMDVLTSHLKCNIFFSFKHTFLLFHYKTGYIRPIQSTVCGLHPAFPQSVSNPVKIKCVDETSEQELWHVDSVSSLAIVTSFQ